MQTPKINRAAALMAQGNQAGTSRKSMSEMQIHVKLWCEMHRVDMQQWVQVNPWAKLPGAWPRRTFIIESR